MGKSLVALAAIGTAVSAGASVIGGIQQKNAADDQAAAAQKESELRARAEARENIALESRQRVAFLNSGVSLEGSPLLVLEESRRRGSENVGSILQSGQTQASSLRASGRSALIGGIGKAAQTGFSAFGEK